MDESLKNIILNFENSGSNFVIGKRNKIKTFEYNNQVLNIKSFKTPNLIIGFIYNFFRKSKARRSFEHAQILLKKGIGTPRPIAFYEEKSLFRLKKSYYISEHLVPDFVFKDLFIINYPDTDEVVRQLGVFCYKLHEAGIEFLDHSPGNTLIKKNDNGVYDFYLVDLNRMKFHNYMNLNMRLNNLRRLTPSEHHIKIISSEYAKLINMSENEIYNKLLSVTKDFFKKSDRKRNFKRLLKLGK